jgi:hypothetical protein
MAKADRELASQLKQWVLQKQHRLTLSDDLAQPRDLHHFAYFSGAADADAAIRILKSAGYAVIAGHTGKRIAVEATRSNPLTDESVSKVLTEIISIVVASGGDYDGFGSEVVVAP